MNTARQWPDFICSRYYSHCVRPIDRLAPFVRSLADARPCFGVVPMTAMQRHITPCLRSMEAVSGCQVSEVCNRARTNIGSQISMHVKIDSNEVVPHDQSQKQMVERNHYCDFSQCYHDRRARYLGRQFSVEHIRRARPMVIDGDRTRSIFHGGRLSVGEPCKPHRLDEVLSGPARDSQGSVRSRPGDLPFKMRSHFHAYHSRPGGRKLPTVVIARPCITRRQSRSVLEASCMPGETATAHIS